MGLSRYARILAYVVLAIVTLYGVREFATSSPAETIAFWRDRLYIVPIVLLFACLDVAFEGVAWMWVCSRMGIRATDRLAIGAFLTPRAGLLLPAQLGRLIRPDTMSRLGRGSFGQCVKAEGATFLLDATSVVALMAALLAGAISVFLAPVAIVLIVAPILYLGARISGTKLAGRLDIPPSFWWSWRTVGILSVQMSGWVVHGVALYLIIHGLADGVTLPATIFFTSGSAVLGNGTGLPGGLGATEGLLGASLRMMAVPVAHLAVAIGAFRLLTFWVWIPVGWLALLWTKRATAPAEDGDEADSPRAIPVVIPWRGSRRRSGREQAAVESLGPADA